jgi:hypothetical protein
MSAPVENETVFVRVIEWGSRSFSVTDMPCGVREARVLRSRTSTRAFDILVLADGGSYGTHKVDEEGITWARPEHADALRVTVALSP